MIWEDRTDIKQIEDDLKGNDYDMYGERVNNAKKNNKKKKKDIGVGVLYVNKWIMSQIKKCMKNKTRFIIIPIEMVGINRKSRHANMLIYDKVSKTAERYEPHGVPGEFEYGASFISRVIDNDIRQFLMDKNLIKTPDDYFGPLNMCPNWTEWKSGKIGHQRIQELENKGFSGSCATWTVWYTGFRLSNPNLDRDQAMEKSFKHLRDSSPSFTKFISSYFSQIYQYSLQ